MHKSRSKNIIYGSDQLYLLKNCIHNAENPSRCVMCMMVNIATKKYFDDEADKKESARLQSLINRATMRTNLLFNWSANQQNFYWDYSPASSFEILISRTMASSISTNISEEAGPINFEEIFKLLERRNRIGEVGHFAVIFLQSRIRKFITRCRLRKELLRRFELVHATRRRPQYFIDLVKSRKFNTLPKVLKNENPASPRTIERRLNAEQKKQDARFKQLRYILSRKSNEDLFRKEENYITFLKQMAVVRDTVRIAMHKITKQLLRKEYVNLSTNGDKKGLQKRRPSNESSNKSKQTPSKLASAVTDLDIISNRLYHPVWVSLGAPSAAARNIGLSLALETPSPILYPLEESMSSMRRGSAAGTDKTQEKSTPAAVAETAAALGVGPAGQLNRALQILEQRVWESLRCNTPEEVLDKIVTEDTVPVLDSVKGITEDEHYIWNGDLDYYPAGKIFGDENSLDTLSVASSIDRMNEEISSVATTDQMKTSEVPTSSSTGASNSTNTQTKSLRRSLVSFPGEFLPIAIQLRPYFPDRGPNGLFRLFFFEEELVGISAMSPWAFYPEVYKSKDVILSSLKAFTAMPNTRAFIRHAMQRPLKKQNSILPSRIKLSFDAEDSTVRTPPPISSPYRRDNAEKSILSPGIGPRKTAILPSPDETLFVPPEGLIFDPLPPDSSVKPLDSKSLTDTKTVELWNKYKFLHKMGIFRDRHKRAEQGINRANEKKTTTDNPSSSDTSNNSKTRRKRQKSPLPRRHAVLSASEAFQLQQRKDQEQNLSDLLNQLPPTPGLIQGLKSNQPNSNESIGTGGTVNLQGNAQVNPIDSANWKEIKLLQNDFIGLKLHDMIRGSSSSKSTDDTNMTPLNLKSLDSKSQESGPLNNIQQQGAAGVAEYAIRLHSISNRVHTKLVDRLVVCPEIPPPKPEYHLFSMDVYVHLPKPNLAGGAKKNRETMSAASSLPNTSRSTDSGSTITAGGVISRHDSDQRKEQLESDVPAVVAAISLLRSETMSTPPAYSAYKGSFSVDVHQVVGTFSCANDRPPPNLDCGLLDWDRFHQMYLNKYHSNRRNSKKPNSSSDQRRSSKQPDSVADDISLLSEMNNSVENASFVSSSKDREWTRIDSTSGLITYRQQLPSGRELSFAILGAPATREYLVGHLPKKVKAWLNLPV